jgi:hypothetical protein
VVTRRQFVKFVAGSGFVVVAQGPGGLRRALAAIPGGTLHPAQVTKYMTSLLIPPVMPKAPSGEGKVGPGIDYYEIACREIKQQILPAPLPTTTVDQEHKSISGTHRGCLLFRHRSASAKRF